MPPRISRRIAGMVQSDIRLMTRECERVGGVNLGQGICDLPTPPLVRDGAVQAILDGRSTYSFAEGAPELREVIAAKLARDNGIQADPASEVVVTAGASGALTCALTALLDPGDGVLIPEPYYGYHVNTALSLALDPHFVHLDAPAFRLREADLRAALRPHTRALILCTPANPTGRMLTLEEIEAVDRVATDADLAVITDEIYEYIRFDDRPHVSPATIGSLRERTVTIMGLSKTFSITGWRLGYAVADAELARAITLVSDIFYICAPTPLQLGAAAGFAAPPAFYEELRASYQSKRDRICEALDAAGMEPIVPEGAYYVLADVAHLGHATAREAAMDLLARTGVAAVSGAAFYTGDRGERFLRFCFAKDAAALDDACRRLAGERIAPPT